VGKGISSAIWAHISNLVRNFEEIRYSRCSPAYDRDLAFTQAVKNYPDPNELYKYMHQYHHHRCPQPIRDHKNYFKQDHRGFGEDAFHAMWWLLFREFRPNNCLEIGVYRGQIISLWALCAKLLNINCNVHGLSPFTDAGDAKSTYSDKIEFYEDTLSHFASWKLSPPILVRAFSTDEMAFRHISETAWDLIYIDGSHDYEIAISDYKLCRNHLKPDGLLVLDDAGLESRYHPPRFAFAGHEGPSRIARENAAKELQFLCMIGHNLVFRNKADT